MHMDEQKQLCYSIGIWLILKHILLLVDVCTINKNRGGGDTLENRPLTKKAYSGTNKLPVWVGSDILETSAKWFAESKHDDKKFHMLK